MELITLSTPIAVSLPGHPNRRVKMVSVVEAVRLEELNAHTEQQLKIVSILDQGEMCYLAPAIYVTVKLSNIRSTQVVEVSRG